MEEKVLELYKFFQQRYLWQFYSRAWDRDENISSIFGKLPSILSGEILNISDSLKEKAFYAEAKTVAIEIKERFPWISEMDKSQIKSLVAEVKAKIIDTTITKSQNGELNIPNY